jgi:hypothetical protein
MQDFKLQGIWLRSLVFYPWTYLVFLDYKRFCQLVRVYKLWNLNLGIKNMQNFMLFSNRWEKCDKIARVEHTVVL